MEPSRRDALRLLWGGIGGVALFASKASLAERPLLQRRIPSTGEEIPAIGLGTWQTFDVGRGAGERAPLRDVLSRFVGRGARLVDSSPMYGRAEEVVGDLAAELSIREKLFLATKVWTEGREAGIAQMKRSLARFRVPKVDLIEVHNLLDADTHLETLTAWKKEGRVRYVGVTHYLESAFPDVEAQLRKRRLDFVQINYSLAERGAEKRLLSVAKERGAAVIVNRPFGGGDLLRRLARKPLPAFASEIDCATWAQLLLKYVLGHPAVTCVIPATSKVKHLDDDLDAGLGRLPDEAMRRKIVEAFEKG